PCMQFLFVSSGFRLQLPSDSASRRTPLPSANSSYCQACSGLSPPSYSPCRAHLKREQLIFSMPSLLMNYFFVGRSLFFQFSKPPSILTTFLKPFFCKILAAIAERFPVRQCTATGLSCGTSAKRSGR